MYVYAICTEPHEVEQINEATVRQPEHVVLVTSLTEAPPDAMSDVLRGNRLLSEVQNAQEILAPLVRSVSPVWPTSISELLKALRDVPTSLPAWTMRNLLWQMATGGFMYWISETTTRTADLTVHLTVASMLGQSSVGILPSDMRSVLETPTLTMTSHIVGAADHRALSLVLRSLNRGTDGNQ